MAVLYEVSFRATKTCQNGNEKTETKKVLMKPYDITTDGNRFHRTVERQTAVGTALLKGQWYYNIEYLSTRTIHNYAG